MGFCFFFMVRRGARALSCGEVLGLAAALASCLCDSAALPPRDLSSPPCPSVRRPPRSSAGTSPTRWRS
jgi:hypothetical protein